MGIKEIEGKNDMYAAPIVVEAPKEIPLEDQTVAQVSYPVPVSSGGRVDDGNYSQFVRAIECIRAQPTLCAPKRMKLERTAYSS